MGEWFGVNDGGDAEQWGFDVMCKILVLLASGASFDVFRDPCSCAGPKVFLVYPSNHFVPSRVAAEGSIVPRMHQFAFQSLIWRNDESVGIDVSLEWGIRGVYLFD